MDLIRLLFSLIGDFWFVFIIYLFAKLFGAVRQKGTQQRTRQQAIPARPVLTPVAGGGTWQPKTGTSMVREAKESTRMSAHEGESEREQPSPVFAVTESIAATAAAPAVDTGLRKAIGAESVAASRFSSAAVPDAREGMKWAMIFSPPRAKLPYKRPGMPPHSGQS